MNDCPFCRVISGVAEARIVWHDSKHVAFLDGHPVKAGHILLIPRNHIESIFDLDDTSYSSIFSTAKKLSVPLQRALSSKKVGLVVEGFGVAHAHIHLVPINAGGELDPNVVLNLTENELDQCAEKIRKSIAEYL